MREGIRGPSQGFERYSEERQLEENFGDTIDIKDSVIEAREAEYALEADGIENLTLVVTRKALTVKDIRAVNKSDGAGTRMIDALIATAEEEGCELIAENVMPESEVWWRSHGFKPKENNSADYVYRGIAV